ncbi:sigma-70 family RNA polymerase sigma factor [Roseiconus nitratireducens]|uniref:Sigma-70 family RNA polymerase sigma factor n=1 Tax=Roseiconus nitratireducens TaxID=2605748 RepID=A0A5M6DJF9_9BACT|nr:ECF-type sigma factor [Roseiconus nitratireducens]KAA5545425.1 sigma-70 family RNA polymerase sigma factor [Roseiconus nitratireducens]
MKEDVTQILNAIEHGDPEAPSRLLPLVYDELRSLAAIKMTRESAEQTLQPTALVHEAYLRLVGGNREAQWDNRGHFFAAAAESMRRILIEQARRRKTAKRGGDLVRRNLDVDDVALANSDHETLLALDEALNRLALVDPNLARLVELRYFTGLTIDETAKVLGVSPRTTKRNWAYARAWLRREMEESD